MTPGFIPHKSVTEVLGTEGLTPVYLMGKDMRDGSETAEGDAN